MEQESNCTFLDQYKITDVLGQGYHACVLKGIGKNGEVVAIKRYRKQSADLSVLNHELSIMLELNHENLARVIEARKNATFQENGGKSFQCIAIILQHIGGGELFDYIATPGTGKFSEKVTRTYFSQLMNALHYLHSKGYAHRDIKPQNILLTDTYVLKLSDFGFSSKLQGHDQSGILRTNLGSEGYKAPEIYMKRYNGAKTDLFAAGVMLFIMYSGSPPFESAQPADRVYNLIRNGNWKVFWNAHSKRKPQGFFTQQFKELFQSMVCSNPDNRLTIEQIAQHKWIKNDICSHEEIIKQFDVRKQKIDAQREAKRREEEKMKSNRTSTGDQHRGDEVDDKQFQKQYSKLLKSPLQLKPVDRLGKQGFFINEKIEYALPALTTYFNNFQLLLEEAQVDPEALEKPDIPVFKKTDIQIEGSKVKVTFECSDFVENEEGDDQEIKNVVRLSIDFGLNNDNLAIDINKQEGDYFFYKRIAGAIKDQFRYCLV